MHGQPHIRFSRASSQHCMSAKSFRGTAPTFTRHQSFRFFFVGTQTLSALSCNCKRKAHFTDPVSMPAKPSASTPGRLKGCVNPDHTCTDSGGGRLEYWLFAVTWWTIRIQQLSNCEPVSYMHDVNCEQYIAQWGYLLLGVMFNLN